MFSTSTLIRFLFVFCVVASTALIYYVMVIKKDFAIYTNPDGPDTSDYFLTPEE